MSIAELRRELEHESGDLVFIVAYYLEPDENGHVKTRYLFVDRHIMQKIYNTGFIKTGNESEEEYLETLENVTGDFHYKVAVITTLPSFEVNFYYITDDLLELANHEALLIATR